MQNAPWLAHPSPHRRVTVRQVRDRCRELPPPGRNVHALVAEPRAAAILVPVVDVDGEAALVITKRPATMTHHRGDWVFPGGRVDPAVDRSPLEAARREAQEELGIPPDRLDIVGRLASHGPIVSGFVIEVFVGIVADPGCIVADPREVADLATVTIATLATAGAYRESTVRPQGHDPGPAYGTLVDEADESHVMRFFTIRPGEEAWGTQGNIIHELLSHLLP